MLQGCLISEWHDGIGVREAVNDNKPSRQVFHLTGCTLSISEAERRRWLQNVVQMDMFPITQSLTTSGVPAFQLSDIRIVCRALGQISVDGFSSAAFVSDGKHSSVTADSDSIVMADSCPSESADL